tara:strand:+ start:334 stop:483 length:150 start_codon:yes stop_codon:yes gene_type:complete
MRRIYTISMMRYFREIKKKSWLIKLGKIPKSDALPQDPTGIFHIRVKVP